MNTQVNQCNNKIYIERILHISKWKYGIVFHGNEISFVSSFNLIVFELDELKFNFIIDMAVTMEVYRLLRELEDPNIDLYAKAPYQPSSIVRHVAYGSGSNHASRFISTCRSLEDAQTFRSINQYNRFSNGPIVKISIVDGMTVYDLNNPFQIEQILLDEISEEHSQQTITLFREYAEARHEVLIQDHVPFKNFVILKI